jgi:hypothetical protein
MKLGGKAQKQKNKKYEKKQKRKEKKKLSHNGNDSVWSFLMEKLFQNFF